MIAGVVDEAGEGGVGELLLLDEVAPPQLDRVDAGDLGQAVHGPLDGVGGLGPTGAAVRVGRRHRGVHARAGERVGLGQVVDAGVEEGAQQRHARGDEHLVAAHVRGEVHPDAGELAVSVGGQLDLLDLTAALHGGLGSLGALLGPSHRHPVLGGQRQAEQLLGVDLELGSEPAADRRGHHAELLLGRAQRDGGHDLEDVGDLGGAVERHVAAERLRDRRARTGLHGHGDEALLDEALLHGERRRLEGGRRARRRRSSAPTCRPSWCRAPRGPARGR